MRIGWSHGFGERVHLDGDWSRLARALARRQAEIVPVSDPDPSIAAAVLAAPSERLGPARVKAWRDWADHGGRLLVLGVEGGDGVELDSDAGLALPGLALAPWHVSGTLRIPGPGLRVTWAGSAFSLRNSASILPPDEERAGRLWPRGRGWFRFGRSHDLLEAWPLPEDSEVSAEDGVDVKVGGWAWLHVGLGDGALLGLADAHALSDAALAAPDHVHLLSHVLQAWLPAAEPSLCRSWLAHRAPDVDAVEPDVRRLVAELAGEGLRLGDPGDAQAPLVARAPAFRALGDAGLVRWAADRIRLTERGRERIDVVSAVFDARAALRRADLAD